MAKYRVDTAGGSYVVETDDSPAIPDPLTAGAPDVSARMRADVVGKLPDANAPLFNLPAAMGIDPRVANANAVPYATSQRQAGDQIVQGLERTTRGTGRDVAAGAHQMIGGAMEGLKPLVAVGAVLNPVGTAVGLGAGMLASKGTEAGLEGLGVAPEYSQLAGDVTGIAAGGKAGEAAGDTLGPYLQNVPDLAKAGAVAVANKALQRSGTPEQRAGVDWALERGAPLDAASATLNPVVRGTQELARNTPGAASSAESAINLRNQWYAQTGRDLAGQLSPMPVNPETVGRSIASSSTRAIQAANAEASASYNALRDRELDPRNVTRVQTGTENVTDADGNTTKQPVFENVGLPVDLSQVKAAARPQLAQISRQVRLGQSQYAPAQIALEDLVNGPDIVSASTAEGNLGALKGVARKGTLAGGVYTQAGGLAADTVGRLQSSIDNSVLTQAGPDALNELQTGRLKTAQKWDAINLVDSYRAEPVKLYQQLTQSKDGGIDMLRAVQKLAPESGPQLGSAWLNGAMDKATESGGFDHAARLFNDYQNLGDATKDVLFPSPQMREDVGKFFQSAKDSAAVENKSGTARVAHIGALGAEAGGALTLAFFNPVAAAGAVAGTGLQIIGGNVLSRLLYNPRFVRAAIRGFDTPAGSAGSGAAASALAAAAGPELQSKPPLGPEALQGAPENAPAAVTPAAAAGAPSAPGAAPAPAPALGSAETNVSVPGSGTVGGYKAQYKLRELADLQASHNGMSFQPNPQYGLVNDRNYANAVNQGKIIQGASKSEWDPTLHITDNSDASNGPVITDPAGNVVGGNGRKMMLDRVYSGQAGNPAGAAAYRDLLTQKAGQFGIDPAAVGAMKQPVLTREISDAEFTQKGGKQRAVTDFNKVGTAALTPAEQSIADSRLVSQGTLEHIAGELENKGSDASLRDVLDGSRGEDVLNRMIKDGVISPQESAKYVSENHELTPEGKDRIEALMLGRFFSDPKQLDAIAPKIRNQVSRIAAPLAQVEGRGEWNLTPHVQEALNILQAAQARGIKNVGDFIQQDSLFGAEKYSPQAVALAKSLQGMKADELKAAGRQYAGDASYGSQGAGLFGAPPTPAESFADAFERKQAAPEAAPAPANTLATPAAANTLAPSTAQALAAIKSPKLSDEARSALAAMGDDRLNDPATARHDLLLKFLKSKAEPLATAEKGELTARVFKSGGEQYAVTDSKSKPGFPVIQAAAEGEADAAANAALSKAAYAKALKATYNVDAPAARARAPRAPKKNTLAP